MLDANNFSNYLIEKTIMMELFNTDCFRYEFVQTVKELVKLGLVEDDLFNRRSKIYECVRKSDFVAIFI